MLSLNYFKVLMLTAIAFSLLTSCASRNSTKDKQADLYFGAGTHSLMTKQYTDALKNLLKANELRPNNSEILNNLGMAYYFKSEHDMAVRTLKRALELDKENSDAKVNLASIYYKDGNVSGAEKLYKEVLKDLTYEKQARTLFNLGLLNMQSKNNLVSAENYFKKSIKEDDNYCPAYFHLGLLQFQRRQFNSALKNFKEAAMGICYESPAPHYYQALSLINVRRFEEARIKLDEVETRFKKSSYAVRARAKVVELNEMQKNDTNQSHASRNVLESPDF